VITRPVDFLVIRTIEGTQRQVNGERSAGSTDTAQSDAVNGKAVAAVLNALSDGPLTRADLIRALAHQLAGDADANAIISLVVHDDFHRGKPWKYDGMRAALSQHEDRLRRMSEEGKNPWHHGLVEEMGDMLKAGLSLGVVVLVVLGVIGLLVFGLKQLF
jgi:hypothetical protein